MKRVCFIGNSHLAALKLGWDRLRDAHPGISLTFFGSRGGRACKKLRLVQGALVPGAHDVQNFSWTSGGSTQIRLKDFDHFVVVALGLGPNRVVHVARDFSFADPRLDQAKRLISRECFGQAVMDILLTRTALAVARTIRAATEKPVWLVPQPAFSIEVMKTQEFREHHGAAREECWVLLSELWTECANRAAAAVGATVVFQPVETMRSHMFTTHELCRDSIRLSPDLTAKHGADDYRHMNPDYGMVMMKVVLDGLAG